MDLSTSAQDLDSEELTTLIRAIGQEQLKPLTPEAALEKYRQMREGDVTDSTLITHISRISAFVEWCEQEEISNMNNLDGRDLFEFLTWRRQQLAPSSLESNMRTIRLFLKKCVKLDAVPAELPEKVEVPTCNASRDEYLSRERAVEILEHLRTYEYATVEHVMWELIIAAGLRIGALHAADTCDYSSFEDGAELHLVHRPETDTGLKNKENSERVVRLPTHVRDVVDDYLANQRPDVTDSHGRVPLLGSSQGRLAKSTMRKYCYSWTRPCVISGGCPHGKTDDEMESCEGLKGGNYANHCPSSKSPHTIRRGHITTELAAGVPVEIVAQDTDVSPGIIDTHYDERSEVEKAKQRRRLREKAYQENSSTGYGV